ncbi:MAG: heme NO-binding domain-containing protein [Alkalilacustris sp.]
MHGLVNRAIQCFLRDVFGAEAWRDIATEAGAPAEGFEAMLRYDDALTLRLIAAATARLDRSRDSLLEDLGTYLVSHPHREGLRRLLRFGGVSFVDFLHSLDDLPGRSHLAVPDLDIPPLEVEETGEGSFTLTIHSDRREFAPLMIGVLRAMADDYGALALPDHARPADDGSPRLAIDVFDARFSSGRSFDLAAGTP